MNTDYEKHFAEAKRIYGMSWEDDRTEEESANLIARAQVHATLALAAATQGPDIEFATAKNLTVEIRDQAGNVEQIDTAAAECSRCESDVQCFNCGTCRYHCYCGGGE